MEYLVDDQRHLVCKPYSVENLHAMAAEGEIIVRKWIFNFVADVMDTRKMGWAYDQYVGPTCQEEEDHPSSLMILADRRGYIREEMLGVADFLYFSRILWNELRCAVAGHALIDGGFGGPDSGCIRIYCTRCGKDDGTTWLY